MNRSETTDPFPPAAAADFERSLQAIQHPLLGYIISLTGNGTDAFDILQETNLFLWEHRGEFEAGTSFKAWAFRVAYFKTLAFRRDAQRRGDQFFREDILLHLAGAAPDRLEPGNERLEALQGCLGSLRATDRELLMIRYASSESLADFATRAGRSPASVHTAISRLRLALKQCVERRLRPKP